LEKEKEIHRRIEAVETRGESLCQGDAIPSCGSGAYGGGIMGVSKEEAISRGGPETGTYHVNNERKQKRGGDHCQSLNLCDSRNGGGEGVNNEITRKLGDSFSNVQLKASKNWNWTSGPTTTDRRSDSRKLGRAFPFEIPGDGEEQGCILERKK